MALDPSPLKFERLVSNILAANEFHIEVSPPDFDSGFDYVIAIPKRRLAVEVKYYRTEHAQPILLENAIKRLIESADRSNLKHAVLIVSCVVEDVLRASLERQFGVFIRDRYSLMAWALQAPEHIDDLRALVDDSSISEQLVANAKTDFNDSIATYKFVPSLTPPVEKGHSLCSELKKIGLGKKHWSVYEIICIEILRYLFGDNLVNIKVQHGTEDGLHRFDMVSRIAPTTKFWEFVDNRLSSRYVLFEFKNYSSKIKQGQILTTEKYLLPLALRKVGIILCRKGADKNANSTIAGAMRESGKLMLVLQDDDLCKMLHDKDEGRDPTDYLFDLTDDFLMGLTR